MKMFRKDEGFTLVELMVVVLIIGILVAIAIPVFNNASKAAKVRTCQANQRTIEGAVQQYNSANPTNQWSTVYTSDTVVNSTNKLVTDSYLKSAPICPSKWDGTGLYTVNIGGTVISDGATLITTGADQSTDAAHAHF